MHTRNEKAARQKFLEEKERGKKWGKESQKERKESRTTIFQYVAPFGSC